MDRIVKLRNIKSYLINLDESTDRLGRCDTVLTNLGITYERFPGIKDSVSVVGCGKSHLKLLEKISPLTAIYEDDIEVFNFSPILVVPNECDALYLGVSNHGYIGYDVGVRNTTKATQYNPNFKRIHNMCSSHAIVYLSQKYIESSRKMISHCLEKDLPFDLGLARLHKEFNILTPNEPMFYQKEQPEFTRIVL